MAKLIAAILSRAGRYLALLALILVLLFALEPIKEAWKGRKQAQDQIASLEAQLDVLESQQTGIERELESVEADWRIQQENTAAPYSKELADIESQLEKVAAEWLDLQAQYFDLEENANKLREDSNAARTTLDDAEKASWFYDKYVNGERYAHLLAAKAEFAARDEAATLAETILEAKWREIEVSPYAEIDVRKKQILAEIDHIFAGISPTLTALLNKRDENQQAIARKKKELGEANDLFHSTRLQLLHSAVSAKLPMALSILAGIVLAPVAIKSALYFGLAPMASRLKAIQIISDNHLPDIPEFSGSAVSVDVSLGPHEELVIHPDFLQSSDQACEKRTKWLLNSQLPFSSLMSGMYFLTSIRSHDPASARVVVSSLKDPLGEVGIVTIVEGGAMVIQPRALAGVVKIDGKPIQITRHWRINSTHAWLTFQFRYLVFHGPCRLILKGCRGVRTERPDSEHARLINQAGTLGFTANLGYKTVRTETFFPYLRGKEDLFNDLFMGDSGHFIYEELPNGGRKSGILGRGLEGLTDAFLKAFGI